MRWQCALLTNLICLNNELTRSNKYLLCGEKYIDAIYYNEMFYFAACWNTAAAVDRKLKNLNSKSSKPLALKDNIRIRVIGLCWEYLSTHWSNNDKAFTPEDLALHLKMIVSKQQSRSTPTKPRVLLPAQNSLPQLDTQAPEVVAIDANLI